MIGQRIKNRRKDLKMSADELARRLNKDRSTVYRYENGDIENLPLDVLEPIAKALETTPAYLMGWSGKIEKDPVTAANKAADMLLDPNLVKLIDLYNQLDEKKQEQAYEYMQFLLVSSQKSQNES